jgi:ATP-binding cassette subfamily B protein
VSLATFAWPEAQIGDAIAALARHHRLPRKDGELAETPPSAADDVDRLDVWIDKTCAWLGLEAEPLAVAVSDLDAALGAGAPALVRLPAGGVLAVTSASPQRLRVIDRDLRIRSVRTEEVARALVPEDAAAAAADAVLSAAEVAGAPRARARAALLRAMQSTRLVRGMWLIRLPPSAGFGSQLVRARVPGRVALLLAAHALATLLAVVGFWLIGRAALEGRIDHGWLAAWALVVATQVPLAIYVDWAEVQVAIDVGATLKRRLLAGALALDADVVRTAGAGDLLGRSLESEVIEAAALTGAFTALTAAVELAFAVAVLVVGAEGPLLATLLAIWAALTVLAGRAFVRRRAAFTETRIAMTHDLTERMVGHRTLLAQQVPERWHHGEDEVLRGYFERSGALDASTARLTALLPKAWVLVAVLALAFAFASGSAAQASLAVSLGGILMGERGLRRAAAGGVSLGSAAVAWQTVAPLFRAGARVEAPPEPGVAHAAHDPPAEGDAVEVRDVFFRHRPSAEPVLASASLRLERGDRVLLEGRSGSGKSTLASILCGLRQPQSGLVLARGLDRRTLGLAGWRRRVACAPQFHENHVISSSLAFNLLLGRRWPPRPEDLGEAVAVCRELALDSVIGRMPSGMEQPVGETGWQLSHGEQSRLFIARALLQDPDVVVLDESLAALDPETLERVIGTVQRRARTLVVIAHP